MFAIEAMTTGEAVFGGVVLLGAAVVVFIVGRMSAAGTLPRNWMVGIRVPSTLASDEAWETAHKAGGWLMQLAAIGPLIAGIVTLFRPSGETAVVAIFAGLIWLVLFVIASGFAARRALRDV